MESEKTYELDSIKIGDREITPIASLKVSKIGEVFINIDFSTVAIKIIENDKLYLKNISLSEDSFKSLENKYKKGKGV